MKNRKVNVNVAKYVRVCDFESESTTENNKCES